MGLVDLLFRERIQGRPRSSSGRTECTGKTPLLQLQGYGCQREEPDDGSSAPFAFYGSGKYQISSQFSGKAVSAPGRQLIKCWPGSPAAKAHTPVHPATVDDPRRSIVPVPKPHSARVRGCRTVAPASFSMVRGSTPVHRLPTPSVPVQPHWSAAPPDCAGVSPAVSCPPVSPRCTDQNRHC